MTKHRSTVAVKVNNVAVWHFLTRKNLAQNELANRLGISSGYMAQLIGGSRSPSPKLRRKMLSVLNPMSFDNLFLVSDRAGLDHQ